MDETTFLLCHERMIGWVETPVGWARVEIASETILSLSFTDEAPDEALRDKLPKALVQAAESCTVGSGGLPAQPLSGTPFQRKVWNILSQIPRGEKWTYRKVAEKVVGASHARAVAQACSRNTIAFFIPCHRVVATDGIGGYRWGIEIKRSLLEWEGGGGHPAEFFRSFCRADA